MAGKYELAVREYFGGILDGRIVACEKMKRVAERIMHELDYGQMSADGSRFFQFSESHAARHVGFIELFCLGAISTPKKPIEVQPFQRAVLSVIYGFVDQDGYRQYREVLWIMGRKNSKSVTSGAIQLDMLVNTDEPAPEVYSASNSIDQSKKVWQAARRMAAHSPAIRKHIRFIDSRNTLRCKLNDGELRALSSDTSRLDGLDVSSGVIDELGAMRNPDIYDLVTQGTGARLEPLIIEITTCGFVRGGIYDAQYAYATKWLNGTLSDQVKAERFIPFIYELDDKEEAWDEAAWIKANPGLGPIKTWDYMRANVSKAKDDPRFYKTLMVKDFNMPETSSEAWLDYDELHNAAPMPDLRSGFDYYIAGIDLSRTTDLTAATALMMRRGDDHIYALHMAWIPEDALSSRSDAGMRTGRDGVPYDLWIEQGLLRTCPGSVIDYDMVLEWFDEIKQKYDIWPLYVGVDPYGFQGLTGVRFKEYFGESSWCEVIQGAKTLSQPMQELRTIYARNLLVDGGNPLAEWCRGNVIATYDSNGNVKPDKAKSVDRIDVFASELDAWVVLRDHMEEYKALIGWDGE